MRRHEGDRRGTMVPQRRRQHDVPLGWHARRGIASAASMTFGICGMIFLAPLRPSGSAPRAIASTAPMRNNNRRL